jgi:hypothetical protein
VVSRCPPPIVHTFPARRANQAGLRHRGRAGALLCCLLLCAAVAHADDPPTQVPAAFGHYVAALADRDGAAAVGMVTRGSLAREERLRDLALAAPPATVAALPMTDRLAVLRLRHEFTAAELRPLSGADLIPIAVEEAWSSPKPLAALTVVGVERAGDTATLRVERAGEPVPVRLVFRREQGTWKIDLVELARGSDAPLAETLASRTERAKVPVEEVMRWVIEDTSGHLVDKDLWQPLAPD